MSEAVATGAVVTRKGGGRMMVVAAMWSGVVNGARRTMAMCKWLERVAGQLYTRQADIDVTELVVVPREDRKLHLRVIR